MKPFLTFLIVTCVYLGAFGQDTEVGKLDFSFGIGMRGTDVANKSLSEYQEMFPDNDLLQGSYLNDYYYGFNSSTMINLLWGIRLRQNERFEQRLRVGVTFGGVSPVMSRFYKESSYAFDTLTSSQTGESMYVDSVYRQDLFLSTNQNEVGLDVSYLIKLNPQGRWCFYSGIGLDFGAILPAKVEVTRSSSTYFNTEGGVYFRNSSFYSNARGREIEYENIDGGFFSTLYLPVGIDFRFSMINPFWRRVHYYLEMRPSVRYTTSQLAATPAQITFGVAFLGIRADF